ncbi:hydantoinase/oxoprolinase family protein [Parapusillimonas sp. SGNA-6]|nr:hydantoinase/oxoprolinase family protein [Parapusillimonas sp. SGNA-6]
MIKVGVDVGGTFTDIVCIKENGTLYGAKVSSTPDSVIVGVLNAIKTIASTAGIDHEKIDRLVHSSTVATNAILEGKVARIGMLMTEGFEDVLEIGRQSRSKLYDLFLDPETPSFIASGRFRKGVKQRIDAEGNVVVPLDENSVVEAARYLVEQQRVEAIAVCYLFSFRNDEHERRTAEIIKEMYPGLSVSLSSEVMPVTREYPRTCVTAFDCSIRPVIEKYLRQLESALGEETRLEIMLSRGGLSSVDRAVRRPAMMIASGPAASVIGAQVIGEEVGISGFVSIDIGGTSADIAMVTNGTARKTTESYVKGYPLPLPTIDVVSIGAGGGSIAWFDDGGGLHVGPQSAGSTPGPACYPNGGQEATVTDASLVLGYLNPTNFADGVISLNMESAQRVIGEVADRLKVKPEEAASGIHRVINAHMADQVRLMTLSRGYDPSRLWLLAAGGGGCIHASALSRDLRMGGVIVPRSPGLIAAVGLLMADIELDYGKTVHFTLSDINIEEVNAQLAQFRETGVEELAHEGIPPEQIEMQAALDIRYIGQSYEIEIPVTYPLSPTAVEAAVSAFHKAHEAIYGHSNPKGPTEILNLRVTLTVKTPKPMIGLEAKHVAPTPVAQRAAYFPEEGRYIDTPVYDRNVLPAGSEIPGPAILEQLDTTVLVLPGDSCLVHSSGHLLIRKIR